MRISDWSSDVCSSDLQQTPLWPRAAPNMEDVKLPPEYSETATNPKRFAGRPVTGVFNVTVPTLTVFPAKQPRSEDSRVGKECSVRVVIGGRRILKKKNK